MQETVIMSGPQKTKIWKVRQQLLKDHGGMEGLWKYVKTLEAEQAQRGKVVAKPFRTRT
jgi:hypothetical protein